MFKTGIGIKINFLISKKKITKTRVANFLKISRPTLDDYISERTSITVEKIYELSKLLKIEPYQFFIDNYDIEKEKDGIDRAFDELKNEIKKYIDQKIK